MTRYVVSLWIVWLGLCSSGAVAQSLKGIEITQNNYQTTVKLDMEQMREFPDFHILEGKNSRLVLDFKKARLDMDVSALTWQSQHILAVRHGLHGDFLRLVFDLDTNVRLQSKSETRDRIILHFIGEIAYKKNKLDLEGKLPIPHLKPRASESDSWRPVIVIDAGHGGRDPGALGARKTKEKAVTLSAAKELEQQLKLTGNYKLVLTRRTDIYLDHETRLRMARKAGADLFISIHADSAPSRTARGASVYTLAGRALGRARNVINRQNWIMDVNLAAQSEAVSDVLVDLALRKKTSQSTQFANILISELSRDIRLIGNSHRQAGYYVLLAPDVPAVLLELGFLSSRKDESLLRKHSHRRKTMKAVVRSIERYFGYEM